MTSTTLNHRKRTVSAVALVILFCILAAGVVFWKFGAYSCTTYYCICGAKKDVLAILGCAFTTSNSISKIDGVPEIGPHEHHWNYLCHYRQRWGGEMECGDGFGFECLIYARLDEMVKEEVIPLEVANRFKHELVDDEINNNGKNSRAIVQKINDLIPAIESD